MDFPPGEGVLKEELVATPSTAFKKAMDILKSVFWEGEREELGPEISDIAAAEGIKSRLRYSTCESRPGPRISVHFTQD